MKNIQPLLLFFAGNSFLLSLCICFYETLSGYISMIVPVNNEKRLNNEVLEVPVGVGAFTSTSSFDTESLQFVTMNKLKRSMPGGL